MSGFTILARATLPAFVAGHFAMLSPPTWHDAHGLVGTKPGAQCRAGCTGKHASGELEHAQGCNCQWYTNWTFVENVTIAQDSPLRTYQDTLATGQPIGDWTCRWQNPKKCTPWRAPGAAPVNTPCGVDGGNADGCPFGNPSPAGCAGGGYGHGPDARLKQFPGVVTTKWQAGSTVEAKWGITANHGGGYSYRLCKMPSGGKKDLTEDCFQKTVLQAIGNHTVAYANGTEALFPAVRTSNGTFPVGSQWTRNPIPACSGPGGGSLVGSQDKCTGLQFPPPLGDHELAGFGNHDGDGKRHAGGVFMWHVVDQVQVPSDLSPGSYVLSLRWDCEQTPQVWSSCADISITAHGEPSTLV